MRQIKVLFSLATFVAVFVTINCYSEDIEYWSWSYHNYPNLTSPREAKFCTGPLRNPPSSICDPDQVLSKHEIQRLDQLISQENNDTKCLCDACPPHNRGLNIKVAIARSIASSNFSTEKSMHRFADKTRRRWNFGDGCDNDVLIFLTANDDLVNVSLGSKAREVVPFHVGEKILRETEAHFASSNYMQGLESIIASYQDMAIQYDHKSHDEQKLGLLSIFGIVFGALIIIIIILFAIWMFIKREKFQMNDKLSFEYINSWSRNRNKNKPSATEPKTSPIYKPVETKEQVTEEA